MSDLRERLRICSLAQLYTTRDSDLFSHTRTHRARDEAALSEDFLSFPLSHSARTLQALCASPTAATTGRSQSASPPARPAAALASQRCSCRLSILGIRTRIPTRTTAPCRHQTAGVPPTRTTTSSTSTPAATPSSAPSAPRSRNSAQASATATPRRSWSAPTQRATSSGCKATGASVRSRAPPPARRAVNPASGPAKREATSAGSCSTAHREIGPIDLLLSAVASSPRVLPAVALAPGSLGRGFQPPSPPGSGSGPRFPRPWLPAPERPPGVCGVCLRGQVYSIKSE